MKQTFKNKGVASIEELREICLESGVKMIGCQMTMDVFGFSKEDFIDGVEVGGAATFLEFAADSDIQLFVWKLSAILFRRLFKVPFHKPSVRPG